MSLPPAPRAVSLFSGGGIGDLGLRAAGVRLLVASELLEDRASVLAANFPEATIFCGDIALTKGRVVEAALGALAGEALELLFVTPPCQGMSKNGRGKLLQGVREGKKPALDPRNQLILHALDVARALRPTTVVIENVPEMESTVIAGRDGQLRGVLELVQDELGPDYTSHWGVVEFADYGIPQRRQRLIAVFSRSPQAKAALARDGTLLPAPTHARHPTWGLRRWVSVEEALQGLPPLDAGHPDRARSAIPFHHVPLLDADKYFWVRHTPPGQGAFDNQCVAPGCGCSQNPVHGARHNAHGVNQANKDTPIRCLRCGELLPRPWVVVEGQHRLMSGFTSAYKRMRGDLPASALTRNLSYACSDQKLHPVQNRVLSLFEAFVLHTVSDYPFVWERADGRRLTDKTIREILGESIPPRGLEVIFRHLLGLTRPAQPGPTSSDRERVVAQTMQQLPLFGDSPAP